MDGQVVILGLSIAAYLIIGMICGRIHYGREVARELKKVEDWKGGIERAKDGAEAGPATALLIFLWPMVVVFCIFFGVFWLPHKFVTGGADRKIAAAKKRLADKEFWEDKLTSGDVAEKESARVWLEQHSS